MRETGNWCFRIFVKDGDQLAMTAFIPKHSLGTKRTPLLSVQLIAASVGKKPHVPLPNTSMHRKSKYDYLRGMKREEWVAPMPGLPCLTGWL